MKISKYLKSLALTSLLAFPITNLGAEENYGLNGRFAWGIRGNQLNVEESKKIYPHQADSGFISGYTTTKPGNGFEFLDFRPGAEAFLKISDNLELTLGADLEINLDGLIGAKNQAAMTDFKQQEGDGRPSGSGSFVYDKVYRDFLGVQPFIGLNLNTDAGRFTAELSKPFQKFKREWGHHRFNKEDSIGSESYDANGFALRFAWTHPENNRKDSDHGMGVEVKFEKYDLLNGNESAGDIKSFSIGVFTRF